MRGSFAAVLLALSSQASAFVYNEHKSVGEKAFRRFVETLVQEGAFPSTQAAYGFFSEPLSARVDEESDALCFTRLSHPPNLVSYGVLNALSGDYDASLFSLAEALTFRYSAANQIIHLQDSSLARFRDGPPYSEIVKIKPDFAYLALVNKSHFFSYGDSLEDHVLEFEKRDLELLRSPKNGWAVFKGLNASNLVRVYLTLHSFALHLSREAGACAGSDKARSSNLLSYAFLFNAFADHFLEDSFAPGHMVVNRTIFGGFIDNKALHDFYNKAGLEVMNLRGDVWRSYGDHLLFRDPSKWKTAESYDGLAFSEMPEAAARAVEAVTQSILEVWRAYGQGRRGEGADVLARIPDDPERLQGFFLGEFKALSLMPLPFNSDLSEYKLPPHRLAELERVNAPLAHRDFVKTRVANSVLVQLGTYDMAGTPLEMVGARVDVTGWNDFRDLADKTGTVDQWLDFTAAFNFGTQRFKYSVEQFKLGGAYDVDLWVSPKRYLGIFAYLETGAQHRSGRWNALLSPAVGIQPGPLAGVDYSTLPKWLKLPLKAVMPFKLVFGPDFARRNRPAYNLFAELDLLF
jgi:hypothetical protein